MLIIAPHQFPYFFFLLRCCFHHISFGFGCWLMMTKFIYTHIHWKLNHISAIYWKRHLSSALNSYTNNHSVKKKCPENVFIVLGSRLIIIGWYFPYAWWHCKRLTFSIWATIAHILHINNNYPGHSIPFTIRTTFRLRFLSFFTRSLIDTTIFNIMWINSKTVDFVCY